MDYGLTVTQIAALMITGIAYALLGSVKVPLSKQLKIDEAGVGGLMSMFGLTLIPMALAAGMLCDLIGRQFIFSSGFILITLSLIVLANSKNYKMALGAVLLFGTGWAAAVNALNVLSPPAFLAPEDIPAKNHYAMNLGDFIFGMGAFLAPLLFAFMIRRIKISPTFYVVAAVSLLPPVLGFVVNWEALIPENAATGTLASRMTGILEGMKVLLQDRVVLICSFAMFFHFPLEFSVATWGTTLMVDKGMDERKATTMLSIFWLTFLASRLITAFALPKGYGTVLIMVFAALAVVGVLGLVFSKSGKITAVLVIILGAVMGPIFPTLIAILLSSPDGIYHGRAVGIFFSLGGIGCTLIPMLVGWQAKKSTLQRGFIYVVACAVALLTLSVALHFNPPKEKPKTETSHKLNLEKQELRTIGRC